MSEKIRVLIVDDIPETRENVRKLLQFESDLEVIGHAGTGGEAIRMAETERPDIVLMDINMPDSDGITASQTITKNVPGTQIIIMSVQSEADYLRRAMLAGARDFLMKPFSGDELVEAVRRVHETKPQVMRTVVAQPNGQSADGRQAPRKLGKVISVFSPKGGTGCTTVAVNIGAALAEAGHETLLLDGSLQFGDVAVMLNLKSTTSIIDLIENLADLDADLVSSVLLEHESSLKVLLAPPRPEMAELVTVDSAKAMIAVLRRIFEYVIIDTSSSLDDVNLAWLDLSDRIVLLTRQDLPSLKNISRFFDLGEVLDYDQERVLLVVNHASKRSSISIRDIEETLKWPVAAAIPEDPAPYLAADQGRPLVSSSWKKRNVSRSLVELSEQLVKELKNTDKLEDAPEDASVAGLARLFNK